MGGAGAAPVELCWAWPRCDKRILGILRLGPLPSFCMSWPMCLHEVQLPPLPCI